MAIIRQIPWTEQPQGAVEVDWGNPLSAGLLSAVDGRLLRDVVAGNFPTSNSTTPAAALPGIGAEYTSKNAQFDFTARGKITNQVTYFALLDFSNTGTPNSFLFGDVQAAGAGYNSGLYSSGAFFQFFVKTGGAGTSASSATAVPARKVVALAGRYTGANLHVFVDGRQDGSAAKTGNVDTGSFSLNINRWNSASLHRGAFFAGFVWNRALSDTEIAEVSANPWQLFAPCVQRIWAPVGGGGGTTITGVVAEASAPGVTALLNTTTQTSVAAAAAVGVTALLNSTLQAGPGAASAVGVTALLNTSVNATPSAASATGVGASIVTAGNTTISAAPGEAAGAGVTARVNITVQAGPGVATATGVKANLPRAVSATPGEAGADGLAAQLQRIFGTTTAEAIAAGVTALVNNASATVGRPTSDTSNSGWTASTGSDLYAMIDEVTPSATDYIVATSVGAVCELALNNTGYPGTASQVLKFRASSSTGNSVIVRLKNTGGATVRSATQALTSTDTEYSIALTSGEIAAITSGALSVQLESA